MRPRVTGFTLVEVMVALLIVALVVPALLFTLEGQIDGAAYLRDKSLAQLVASRKLAEVRLLSTARAESFSGRETGVTRLAERDWYWWLETEETELPRFRRITVRVGLGEDAPGAALVTNTAFLSGDGAPGGAEGRASG